MKKDCRLIGTLPSLHDKKNIHDMLSCEEISEVRFNSGVNELLTPEEIVTELAALEKMYNKKIWLDLKGRQLRINAWADPSYEAIDLNHDIEIEYPAKIIFRGSNESNIIHTKGNKIILDSPPERAVGKGQSVNIKAKSLNIKGYLTPQDEMLITESSKVGMNNYMASFVESESDLIDIYRKNKKANIISKIESINGMNFINSCPYNIALMAARDDLYIELGQNINMLKALREIITKDPNAICASRIFSSLDKSNKPSLSDYEDLILMCQYGYKNYMLADDVKGPKLTRTLSAWRDFINE